MQWMVVKLTWKKKLFSPDAEGIKFCAAGLDGSGSYNFDHNHYFSDVVELSPGKYNLQLVYNF